MSLKSWRARQKVQLEALVCGDNCKDGIAVVGATALALGGDLMSAKMNDEMALQALRQQMQHLESVVQGTAHPEEVSAIYHSAACVVDAFSKKVFSGNPAAVCILDEPLRCALNCLREHLVRSSKLSSSSW